MPAFKPSFPRLRRSHPLAQGLVGAYLFYEGGGLTANDLADRSQSGTAGEGAYGTLSGSTPPTWQGGQSGWCLNFNGSTAYVSLGTTAALNLGGAMSLLAWVNLAALAQRTVAADSSSNGGLIQWALQIASGTGKLNVEWGGNTQLVGTTGLSINTWYFVGFTRSGSSGSWTATSYINGAQDATASSIATNPSAQQGAVVGRLGAGIAQYWSGTIDSVLLWNRALSQGEIENLYADTYDMFRRRSWRLRKAATAKVPWHLFFQPALGQGVA